MNILEEQHQRQIRRETQAQDDAKSLLQKRLSKSLLHSQPANKLVADFWQPLAEAIADQQKEILQSTGTAKKSWRFILALNAECLAYYTLTGIIESQRWSNIPADCEVDDVTDTNEQAAELGLAIGKGGDPHSEKVKALPSNIKGSSRTTVARQLARRSEYQWITCEEKERADGIARCVDKYPSDIQKQEERKTKDTLNSSWRDGNNDVSLGRNLLLLAQDAGIVRIVDGKTRGNRPAKIVTFTSHFAKAFAVYAQQYGDFAAPLRRPMVDKPRSWTENQSDYSRPLDLLRRFV